MLTRTRPPNPSPSAARPAPSLPARPGDAIHRLARNLGPIARRGVSLSSHTTFGLGGPAAVLARPRRPSELAACLRLAHRGGVPWFVLGGGANLLVADEGWPGLTIHTVGMDEIRVEGDRVVAAAGASIRSAVLAAGRAGLAGLEALAGVPGTVGGAVAMNAGTHAGETRDVLESLTLVSPEGRAFEVPARSIRFTYRRAELGEHVVAGATFRLTPDDPDAVRGRVRDLLAAKKRTQPLDRPTAGCVFRNPPGDSAGRLIDEAGLKGLRIGGAEVSTRHANFIVRHEGATAAHVRRLIERVRTEVRRSAGVHLALELRFPGLPPEVEA